MTNISKKTEHLDSEKVKQLAAMIEMDLASFGINTRVIEIDFIDKLIEYRLQIATGTRVKDIKELKDDLALALAIPPDQLELQAPIPGKTLVGIRLPLTYVLITDKKKNGEKSSDDVIRFDDSLQKIADEIRELQTDKEINCSIFISNSEQNYFVQVLAVEGKKNFLLEAVSNLFLKPENQLALEKQKVLTKMGWSINKDKGKETSNYYQSRAIITDSDRYSVACYILQTLIDGYGFIPNTHLEICSDLAGSKNQEPQYNTFRLLSAWACKKAGDTLVNLSGKIIKP